MHNFFSGTKYKITLCILIALLLGIFVAAVSGSGTSPLSSVLNTVMSPLENLASDIASSVDNFNGYFTSSKKYKEKIDELESEIDDYKEKEVDYQRVLHKLDAYEKFLDIKDENPDFEFVPASIIMKDSSDVYGSFTLNKGSSDGIQINDPVIFGTALVGVVKAVSTDSCTIYTLYNPSVSVSAYEIRTREDCYATSDTKLSSEGLIKLEGLSRSTPVVPGGIICTSGIGGIYPKDLIIGSIKEVVNDGTGMAVYATIEPDADYSQLTDVFIITDFKGQNN